MVLKDKQIKFNEIGDYKHDIMEIQILNNQWGTELTYDPYGICDFAPFTNTSPYILAEGCNLPEVKRKIHFSFDYLNTNVNIFWDV